MTRCLSLAVLSVLAISVAAGTARGQVDPAPDEPPVEPGDARTSAPDDEWATPDAEPVTEPPPETPDVAAAAALLADPDKDREYKDRLREMEEDVVRLKEKIYKTKVRLNLLKERILSNVVAEAWAVITHRNEMSRAFRLDQVQYYLDGKKLYFKTNAEDFLAKNPTIEVFRGNVVPGNHTLSVKLLYTGQGKFFTYLKGYKFEIASKYTFYTSRGRIVKLDVTGYEKGGPTYSLEEKPAIKFAVVQLPFNKENIARLTSGQE
ncbi:MAG: dihydrolipoamide acetyltransferase [Deltaproteobacteria bacterium]|nr:dihydrolipoamide acetyltransferase [Deltaproteobacteria bacterium]